jgi:hypothetical protein
MSFALADPAPALSQPSGKGCQGIIRPFTRDSLTRVPGTIIFSGAAAASLRSGYNPATIPGVNMILSGRMQLF